ncbi:hypothetical protein [Crocosphaera chwakensis]|uniref:Uncharacterized protein n=1 Tax=Crocosphaera chwakensis CCY0110 TaxID=391612 RepID=A3IPW9_9CHRO|nr:hypothetical protein [Crocosphaera chwakensis]EAZ91609.1 hypothetical protein CY0110_13851 [Crocosphaera chwakensis CCY0110]
MAKVTDVDIQVLKDLINQRFDEVKTDNTRLSGQIEQMSEKIMNLEIGQAKIETRMDEWKTGIDKIPDLAEKVGELKNWRQIALVIVTASFGGFIGWLLRSGNRPF